MKTKFMMLGAVCAIAFTVATTASAQTAIESFSGGSAFPRFSTDETVGFQFFTNQAITVTELGIYNYDGIIGSSHQVGIWDQNGTLLTFTNILPQVSPAGTFVYQNVDNLTMLSGSSTYNIGARYFLGQSDPYMSGVTAIVTDPAITFLGRSRSAIGSGFSFPSIVDSGGGRFGPNFHSSPLLPFQSLPLGP